MITLSLLKFLENEGYGILAITGAEKNASLFWEKMTFDKKGVYIATVGNAVVRGARPSVNFTLYSRGNNDVDGYKQLEAIVGFLSSLEVYGKVCDLPPVDGYTNGFKNITIMPMDTITSVGRDENGRMIYSSNGTIYY